MEELEYGPIICTDGPFKGRIGYLDGFEEESCYDCEEDCPCKDCDGSLEDRCSDCENEPSLCQEYGCVYWGDFLVCAKYDMVPVEYCSNHISVADLTKRIDELEQDICRKKEDAHKAILLQEFDFVKSLLYEKHIDTRFCEKQGLKLFISHSSKDKWFATALYTSLVEAGQDPWLDKENILGGQSIPREIAKGIDGSDFMILILSENSVASEWVSAEWESFLTDEVVQGKVKIIPVLIGKCKIPRFLKSKKYIDFTQDYNEGIRELLRAIQQ